MRCHLLLCVVTVMAVTGLAACGPSRPPAPEDPWSFRQDSAMTYMKAHPVPPKPGMYTGIVIAGDPPGSRSWILEVAARDGELIEAECGNRAQDNCTWPEPADLLGAYVYASSEGNATADAHRPSGIKVITYQALSLRGMDGP